MKNISKIILVAAGLAATVPFVNAADASAAATTPAPAPQTRAAHPHHQHALAQHRRALQRRLAHKLNLSADQKTQFKTIGASTRGSLKAIRESTALTPEQKKSQVQDLIASARSQRLAVLTPDQRTQLEQIKAKVWQRMGGL